MSAGRAGPTAATPVEGGARLLRLDALRGFALLGIAWANVRQLFLPFDVGEFAVSIGGSERLAWIDWQVFHALVDLKFLTIFSVLFGIGFALHQERIEARGGHFTGIYLRRASILALFGILHGLLLYSAEVLMPYAVAGLMLFATKRWTADAQMRTGLALLGISLLWGYQIGALGGVSILISVTAAALLIATTLLTRHRSWRVALAAWITVVIAAAVALTAELGAGTGDGLAGEYLEAQRQLAAMSGESAGAPPEEWLARQDGSFAALFRLHVEQYAQLLFYVLIFLLWRTLALFLIGAGLFRTGVVAMDSPAAWSRIAFAGLGIGLPLSMLATWLQGRELQGAMDWRWPEFLHSISALPLAAGLAAAVFLLHRQPATRWLWSRIESAGRMALTNYVGQSLVFALLAESWGFGLYGRLGGVELTLVAVAVFSLLAEASYFWLRAFRMGPLEWLWRCGTYWRWLPNR
jgi:uncharacterized protein